MDLDQICSPTKIRYNRDRRVPSFGAVGLALQTVFVYVQVCSRQAGLQLGLCGMLGV